MNSDEPHSRPKRRLLLKLLAPKVGIPLLIVMLLLCAPFAYRRYQWAGLPDIGEPFDVESFCDVTIPDQDNAFVEYRLASETLSPEPDIDFEKYDAGIEERLYEWTKTVPEYRQWLIDNRDELTTWRLGTDKTNAQYIHRRDYDMSTLLDVVQSMRDFARLALLESSRLESVGDMETAWQMHRAAFRASRHVGRNGGMIERLVGIALHTTACGSIVRWAGDLRVNKPMLLAALAEVRANYKTTERTVNHLKTDYVAIRNTLQLPLSAIQEYSPYMKIKPVEAFFRGEPELGRRVSLHWFADVLEEHTNSAEAASVPPHLAPKELERFFYKSPVAQDVLYAYEQVISAVKRERARQAALEMALAAQIHYREHGAFPEKAQAMLQSGLDAIAADPCSPAGNPMQYRVDAKTGNAIVWSVGEDGVDDGGNVESTGEGDHEHPATDVGYVIRVPTGKNGKPTH